MKKTLSLICVLIFVLSIACAQAQDASALYPLAMESMEKGDYSAAAVLFELCGDYEDAPSLLALCRFRCATFIGLFQEGRCCIQIDSLFGFIDETGTMVIEPKYEKPFALKNDGYVFADGRALAIQNNLRGYMDRDGTIVIPIQYADAWAFSDGMAAVQNKSGEKYGFINTDGEMTVPALWEYGYTGFNSGYMVLNENNEYVCYDHQGAKHHTIPGACGSYYGGYVVNSEWVGSALKSSILDTEGKYVLKHSDYNISGEVREGMVRIIDQQSDLCYGFINLEGKAVIKPEMAEVHPYYSNGLVGVLPKTGGSWEYRNTSGETVFSGGWLSTRPFMDNGYAVVQFENGLYGTIDMQGATVIQPEYEEIKSNEKYEDSSCTVFAAKKDGCWYLIDINDKWRNRLLITPWH